MAKKSKPKMGTKKPAAVSMPAVGSGKMGGGKPAGKKGGKKGC